MDGGEKVSTKIRFGESGSSIHIPIIDNQKSLSAKEFFSTYVKRQQPVLFRRAITESKAYKMWSDSYFKGLTGIPEDHAVLIERRKKENRTNPPTHMPFKEFVEIYNLTDQYMVDAVPVFLRLVLFFELTYFIIMNVSF